MPQQADDALRAVYAVIGPQWPGVLARERAQHASALAARPRAAPGHDGKPAFWWAADREPWKRISAEIDQNGAGP